MIGNEFFLFLCLKEHVPAERPLCSSEIDTCQSTWLNNKFNYNNTNIVDQQTHHDPIFPICSLSLSIDRCNKLVCSIILIFTSP